MGWQQPLTKEQNTLFEENRNLVKWVIYKYVYIRTIPGMEFDDLYQVGLIGLWKAVLKYNESVSFSTFAVTVVKRFLYDYSRKIWMNYKKEQEIACLSQKESYAAIQDRQIYSQLNQLKANYHGVALKGIEAIELRLMGYSNREIAEMFHCPEKHVSAWIARAKSRLQKDVEIQDGIAG